MLYLLDTCVVIPLLKGRNGIQEKLGSLGVEQCCLSELVLSELLVGAYKTNKESEFHDIQFLHELFKTIPVDYAVLDRYAQLRALLEQQGNRIDSMDLLIAATALVHGHTLVTHNMHHFSRIPGLKTEDWIR